MTRTHLLSLLYIYIYIYIQIIFFTVYKNTVTRIVVLGITYKFFS